MQNYKYFRIFIQERFKTEDIVYLRVYINISCICKNKTAIFLIFLNQRLLGLTLWINPWLWTWVQ